MNPRTTLILALVAGVLGAFLYFYEIRGGEERLAAAEEEKRVFPAVREDGIEWVSLRTSDQQDVKAEPLGEGWGIVEPIVAPGDSMAIDAIARALVNLKSERVLEDPQPPEVYSLGEKAQVVRFAAGGTEYELRIGGKTPIDANSYVSTADTSRIYTVPSFSVNAFTRALDDLREKRILQFETSAIERIETFWPGGAVTLVRAPEGAASAWRLMEPLEGAADDEIVSGLLSDLSFLRATGFVDEPPPDVEVGLDRPAFRAVLHARAEEEGVSGARYEIAVGGEYDGARIARGALPFLYLIPRKRIDEFPRKVVDYRFKVVSRFASGDADRFELVFQEDGASESRSLKIEGTRGESGWTTTPTEMAPSKAGRLVTELGLLKGSDIVAESMGADELAGIGLSPPNAILRVWGGEDRLTEVHLGSFDGEKGIIAKHADQPEIYRISYALAEHVPVNLEAFENRFVASSEDEEVAPELDLEALGLGGQGAP